jgi:hypothetical protein
MLLPPHFSACLIGILSNRIYFISYLKYKIKISDYYIARLFVAICCLLVGALKARISMSSLVKSINENEILGKSQHFEHNITVSHRQIE